MSYPSYPKIRSAQYDLYSQACHEYCQNITGSTHFTYIGHEANTTGKYRCYCKSSDEGREPVVGFQSGPIKC